MNICSEFYFDAAHLLPNYDGRCANLHGHTYKLEVVVSGSVGKNGMVIDFGDLKKIVNKTVIDKLDHTNLNDMFDNPTAENIVVWIFDSVFKELSGLVSVKLWEGRHAWVEYDGKDR